MLRVIAVYDLVWPSMVFRTHGKAMRLCKRLYRAEHMLINALQSYVKALFTHSIFVQLLSYFLLNAIFVALKLQL